MINLDSPWALPLAGLLVGTIMGMTARWNRFCTLSALERHWYGDDSNGLRSWVLAAATALLTTQLLLAADQIQLHDSFYLGSDLSVLGAVAGGFLFGLGMALVGTCGFGALVRLGGGSMRSLIIVIAIGLAALTAQRGILGRLREAYIQPLSIDLSTAGSQSVAAIISNVTGLSLQLPVALVCCAVLFYWIFSCPKFREDKRAILTGTLIGLCVTAGWIATSRLSDVLYRQVQIESASFVMPPGELVLSLIAVTGMIPDYGIGLIVGVVFGAAIAAMVKKDVQWEACDDARELSRHLGGAFLMGTGGVLATGCTIGQGVSAVSAMAISAPIVFCSICLGAKLGLNYLLEGTWGILRRS